jgi:lipoyl synthase
MGQYVRKPDWLKIRLGDDDSFAETRRTLQKYHLNTICVSGKCPNQAECWSRGTATFMILGDVCTRSCRFCNTLTGKPLPPDPGEPDRVAESIRQLGLKHTVITSVDRDDLPDLGVRHWVLVIEAVKSLNPGTTMETLIPDFQGREELILHIVNAKPDIVSHNLETVERLTPLVRSAAKYRTSLSVLSQLSKAGMRVKSGLMLGLSETEKELMQAMDDLLEHGCEILTLGQYLQPTRKHLPVSHYVHPDEFARYKQVALDKGFKWVESGPLVRSSYFSERQL